MQQRRKTVGVLMLETRFPRLEGDIGNPKGFEFPIIYKVVRGASPKKVVQEQDQQLISKFIGAAQELIAEGAEIITTSCGFLGRYQKEIQAALSVPVVSSSLLMLSELEAKFGKGNVGILTISKSAMTSPFLESAGVDPRTPIGSPDPKSAFTTSILSNQPTFDVQQCETDLVQAANDMVSQYTNLRALLLECTNMPPHTAAIEKATGLPVSSLNNLLWARAR